MIQISFYFWRSKQLTSICEKNLNMWVTQKQPPEVFCKKGVLWNFVKFTGKYLRQSLFFNKLAGLRPATLSKKRLWHRCFPVNFVKFLRTPFLTEHLRWLLLIIIRIWGFPADRPQRFKKRCSKYWKIHRKTLTPRSLFNKLGSIQPAICFFFKKKMHLLCRGPLGNWLLLHITQLLLERIFYAF